MRSHRPLTLPETAEAAQDFQTNLPGRHRSGSIWNRIFQISTVIGIIVLASGRNPEDTACLVRAGLANIIMPPIDPKDLIGKINQICNPRQWREFERFHIPESEVVISVWGMEAVSKLINISRGGVFVEVSGDRSELLLQNNPKLDLRIKTPVGFYEINGLPSKLERLTAIAWDEN